MIELTEHAAEQSTYVIDVSFFDEAGQPNTPNPNTITWTLTDANGRVVNGKDAVAFASAPTIRIVLTGLDLAYGEPYVGGERRVLVKWKYDSTLGNNLNGTDEVRFVIDNFAAITGT